jgi:hypothetical protein
VLRALAPRVPIAIGAALTIPALTLAFTIWWIVVQLRG